MTRIVTLKEVAAYLRVHSSTVYRLLKRGDLHGVKIGRDWRFDLDQIDEWFHAQQQSIITGADECILSKD